MRTGGLGDGAEHADLLQVTFVVVASAIFVGVFVGGVLALKRAVEMLSMRHADK